MKKMMSDKIQKMLDGLRLDPRELAVLETQDAASEYVYAANSPFPALSRYRKYIQFLDGLTSLKALYQYRLEVVIEYFIALAETMANYSGSFSKDKIIPVVLTEEAKAKLRAMPHDLSHQQMKQIELIETRSDHDTAAITDWLKFAIDQSDLLGLAQASSDEERKALENCLDGVHFGRTSEDVNSPVFALINRDLFFGYLLPEIAALQHALLDFARRNNRVCAALTHGQPAEPTTIGKQIANTVAAIDVILRKVFLPYNEAGKQTTVSFPVKTFGAVGNHSDLQAAYPDIDWRENDRRFVNALGPGLHLDLMTTQAGLYGEYKYVYDAVSTISRHMLKFSRDFWGWTSFQWLKKRKKEGVKGSSVMPNKYNPWRIEGAVKILEKFIAQLECSAKALMDYPYEGDMGRSIIMRDIGDDFGKFFIAVGRIREELALYELNEERIDQFLQMNPGLTGGAAQTMLKRARAEGDAYRQIQQIMINPDGTYCSQQEFVERISAHKQIPDELKQEILQKADPKNNTGYADELAQAAFTRAEETLQRFTELGYLPQ